MTARIDPDAVAEHVENVHPFVHPRMRETSEEADEPQREPPSPDPAPQASEVPFYLLEVPGLVGHIARFITKTARFPQPLLSLGAALAIVGTAAGRKYAGPTKSATHLFMITLAPTGTGKAHPAKIARRLFRAANMPEMMGPGRFQSETAVYQVVAAQPQMVCFMDEFGAYLHKINHPRASPHEKGISAVLRSIWSSSFDTVDPPAFAASSNTKVPAIHSPALSIFGMSVHEEFYAALQGSDIDNGFLNRLLVLATQNNPEQVEPELDDDEIPQALVEGLQRVAVTAPGRYANASDWKAEVRLDWETKDARVAFQTFEKDVKKRADNSKLLGRTAEMAVRLATIVAIGRNATRPSISGPRVSLEDITWAIELAMWSAETMIGDVNSYMVESDHQGRANEILRHIKGAPGGKLTRTQLSRKAKNKYDRRALDLILDGLMDTEQIEVTKFTAKGACKPTVIIQYRG